VATCDNPLFNLHISNMNKMKNMTKRVSNYLTIKENISKDTFPILFKMIQLAITLPVSTATSERSFSAVRRIR